MSYLLRTAVWEITLACCFSCKYCGSSGGRARENELTTEECLSVADQLAELGCKRVSMIGGEVFMRRDWKQIVKRLTGNGIATCIITNGYLFRPEHIADLKDSDVESVAVSLDGPKEIHDKYRQTGSYDRAIEAIKVLSENGIHVSVISTLNRENSEKLGEFYETLANLDIFAWQLQACSPMGNAANAGVDYQFDAENVLKFVDEHAKDAPFAMGVAHNIGYYTENELTVRGNPYGGVPFRGCTAGLSGIGIDSIGNVRGCESMYDEYFIEGNLRTQTLKEIWENPDNFAYNRRFTPDKLTGRCSSCEMAAYCAGGCRSYNYFTHKKMFESPLCARK